MCKNCKLPKLPEKQQFTSKTVLEGKKPLRNSFVAFVKNVRLRYTKKSVKTHTYNKKITESKFSFQIKDDNKHKKPNTFKPKCVHKNKTITIVIG